ncbi:DUF3797 domain-containing protein [uncultured Enterococcus sp.]|uniref:DUF3797 domain-containing protein n=1 Tax=uncultured Enterococcus sp. TaxID=167972 RepID=UPI0025990E5C|nr:DUF3797 domain-containing protein [uncultured Enterococcus sp.]
MRLSTSMNLMKKYGSCPKCGNKFVGNGKGGMVIEEYTFERWCKCGWKVVVDVRKDESDD